MVAAPLGSWQTAKLGQGEGVPPVIEEPESLMKTPEEAPRVTLTEVYVPAATAAPVVITVESDCR